MFFSFKECFSTRLILPLGSICYQLSTMNCHCRTVSLGIFVRNIVGLQLPTVLPSRSSRQCAKQVACLSTTRQLEPSFILSVKARTRRFHTPNVAGGSRDAAAAAILERTTGNGGVNDHVRADGAAPDPRQESIGSSAVEQDLVGRRRKDTRSRDGRSEKETQTGSAEAARKPIPTAKRTSRKNQTDSSHTYLERRLRAGSSADPPPKKEPWTLQKAALEEKFPEGWLPRKRLSPDALIGIRALHEQFPEEYTTEELAKRFEVSPEAIRRILKSKWTPSPEEELDRQERWFSRGKQVWTRWAELGKKPPRRWRAEGIVRKPYWNGTRRGYTGDEEDGAGGHKDVNSATTSWRSRLGKNLV